MNSWLDLDRILRLTRCYITPVIMFALIYDTYLDAWFHGRVCNPLTGVQGQDSHPLSRALEI